MKQFNVAIVGLGVGAEFIPLWQKHPHTRCHAICQRNQLKLDAVGDYFGVEKRYSDFAALLNDSSIDAVHINSPIPDHAWMSIAALEAGKHVACTVPMATNIEDCQKIVDLAQRTGLTNRWCFTPPSGPSLRSRSSCSAPTLRTGFRRASPITRPKASTTRARRRT